MDRVLCAIIPSSVYIELDETDIFKETSTGENWEGMCYLIPLIDHPHNDIENGQKEIHYHIDDRYTEKQSLPKYYKIKRYDDLSARINKGKYKLGYFYLKKNNEKVRSYTTPKLIKNSKLKHKCIHKGKCPHRGYDLSNEIADKDGVITCPLHGLKFDKFSKKLINDPTIK